MPGDGAVLRATARRASARVRDGFACVGLVRRHGGEVIAGVSEAAARLEVSRTTIYGWAEKGTLLAWKSTRRSLNIPAAQILGPGKVVPGLADERQAAS